ncbi:hypothetical protein OESDEN_11258 [Oesophagostomum dentatum]|uniref:Receptor ligand binding region domain-containing protein n=1 Tax=Oesophagostomum dentatum TaxID=61180 RepID=A0A0B1SUE0_OESDE|nr:hypothetical protein OESDEN_11258 [Oesophagostomum dentatum]
MSREWKFPTDTVVVVCLAEGFGYKRKFVLSALDGGFFNSEYVYIFADTRSKGFTVPLLGGDERYIWDDTADIKDGRDADALKAFEQILVVSDHMGTGDVADDYDEFGQLVISRMKEPPFYCTEECSDPKFSRAGAYAGQLHDAFYGYALALNATLAENPLALRNGSFILDHFDVEYKGVSGTVVIGKNGTRKPILYFDGLDRNGQQVLHGTIFVDGDNGVLIH